MYETGEQKEHKEELRMYVVFTRLEDDDVRNGKVHIEAGKLGASKEEASNPPMQHASLTGSQWLSDCK